MPDSASQEEEEAELGREGGKNRMETGEQMWGGGAGVLTEVRAGVRLLEALWGLVAES